MGLLQVLLVGLLVVMQSTHNNMSEAASELPATVDIAPADVVDASANHPNPCPPCSQQRPGPMAMYRMHLQPQITVLRREQLLQVPDTKLGSGLFSEVVKVQINDSSFTDQVYAAKVMIKRDGGTSRPQEYGAVESTKLRFAHPGVIAPIGFAHKKENTILLFPFWNGLYLSHWSRLASWNPSSASFQFEFIKLPEDPSWLERVRKQALHLIYAFCSIMHHVHAEGMLHGDLHARNILLHFSDKNENVYIGVSDWGRSVEKGTKEHFPRPPSDADYYYIKQRIKDRPYVAPECLGHNPPPWNETHEYFTVGYHVSTLLDLHHYSSELEYFFVERLRALIAKAMDLSANKRASPQEFLNLFKKAAKYGVHIEEFSGMRPDDE